eukprot:5432228-Prymnesium_polylepis.2
MGDGVSTVSICQYHMTIDWNIKELVLGASPFSERHTAEAIQQKTSDVCVRGGLSEEPLRGRPLDCLLPRLRQRR